MGILDFIRSAQVSSAAYKPSKPYTGSLPSSVVRKGSKGKSVKAVQSFLNWCINAGLKVDGAAGDKTVKAIKKYQRAYGLKADGIFGSKSKAKAKKIIAQYNPTPTPTPTPTPSTRQQKLHNAVEYAKKLAADNSYIYVKWGKADWTKKCCICHKYTGKKKGFNCIRFVFTCWFHGGGIKVNHEGALIANEVAEKMYKASITDAKKMAAKRLGNNNITVIRNKKGIPKSLIQEGDVGLVFKGSKYQHMILLDGKGKMIHAQGSNGKVAKAKQIEYRSAYKCQMIIRYTGE